MKKIMLVFGTRPEAIKMAPLVKELQKFPDLFKTIVCVTGQHREMLDQILRLFKITPDYDLNIMKQGQDLYDISAKILIGMRDVLSDAKPELVLVHGDTTTSTFAAMSAFYQQIPVGHVEAGLRTHNLYSPWPEEMNRVLTGRIAKYHFAPTETSRQNLLSEGVHDTDIIVTGNTVIDALNFVIEQIRSNSNLANELADHIQEFGYDVASQDASRKIVLITGHRRENFGEGFLNICKGIKKLARSYPDVHFVYPMHLNPNVRTPITEVFGINQPDNVFFMEPLDYLDFVYMMDRSYIILTDSGGIQEEAPSLGKPVLVMRDTTERPEALSAGTVKLIGTNASKIFEEVASLLDSDVRYEQMSQLTNPYGDGLASQRITSRLSTDISL